MVDPRTLPLEQQFGQIPWLEAILNPIPGGGGTDSTKVKIEAPIKASTSPMDKAKTDTLVKAFPQVQPVKVKTDTAPPKATTEPLNAGKFGYGMMKTCVPGSSTA